MIKLKQILNEQSRLENLKKEKIEKFANMLADTGEDLENFSWRDVPDLLEKPLDYFIGPLNFAKKNASQIYFRALEIFRRRKHGIAMDADYRTVPLDFSKLALGVKHRPGAGTKQNLSPIKFDYNDADKTWTLKFNGQQKLDLDGDRLAIFLYIMNTMTTGLIDIDEITIEGSNKSLSLEYEDGKRKGRRNDISFAIPLSDLNRNNTQLLPTVINITLNGQLFKIKLIFNGPILTTEI